MVKHSQHHRSSNPGAIVHSRQRDAMSLAKAFDPSRPARPSPLAGSAIRGVPVDLVDRIRSFALFADASDDFLAAAGACLRLQVHAAQESILNEGDDAKAMYWLIRGSVVVTSRDRESFYAELKPGALFGEIGILMNVPRTASVIARTKSLIARLNKEDLQRLLPAYPQVERALREEAAERYAITERNKAQVAQRHAAEKQARAVKRSRDLVDDGDVEMIDVDFSPHDSKKFKPPSPVPAPTPLPLTSLGVGTVNVRQLLKSLPLFDQLPDEFLHFLGLNAEAKNWPPFTTIFRQGDSGRDVYFITRGTVEVLTHKDAQPFHPSFRLAESREEVRARLSPGNFFGEVTSLSLAPQRTASVRAVDEVECLVIRDEVMDDMWRRSPQNLRQRVEEIARQRLTSNANAVVDPSGAPAKDGRNSAIQKPGKRLTLARIDTDTSLSHHAAQIPDHDNAAEQQQNSVVFREVLYQGAPAPSHSPTSLEPFDPDPFRNNTDRAPRRPGLSRRSSLANNAPTETSPLTQLQDGRKRSSQSEVLDVQMVDRALASNAQRRASQAAPRRRRRGSLLPDRVLICIFQHLDLCELMRLRGVCGHWHELITREPDVLQDLDLSLHNRHVTDAALIEVIAPFVGSRPRSVDMSNCFHVTDDGFAALFAACSSHVVSWRMKSVWEVSPGCIIQMADRSPNLESLDFSNCRKVSDALLVRVVGWTGSSAPPASWQEARRRELGQEQQQHHPHQEQQAIVLGCPKLRHITLSYCKHVSDRFMQHLALHAASRLEEMDLTRCTTISDAGFRHWAHHGFPRLRRLVLADCTYLTDAAIACLVRAAPDLVDLDLSFCCALSDAAVDAVAAGLPRLRRLDLAFCGSAVSDASLGGVARGLRRLRELGVRGCVRVTRHAVLALLHGCRELRRLDVSQCRNVELDARWRTGNVAVTLVADGRWRAD